VPMLADEFGRLIRALHDGTPDYNKVACCKTLHARVEARLPGPTSRDRLIRAAGLPRQPGQHDKKARWVAQHARLRLEPLA
jgi:hypothetical protein